MGDGTGITAAGPPPLTAFYAPRQVLRQDLLFAFRAKIDQMLKHFSQQSELGFTGSSILLVYDGHRPAPATVASMPKRRSSALAGGPVRGGGGRSPTRGGGGGGAGGRSPGRQPRKSVLQLVGSAVESALAVGGGASQRNRPGRRPSILEVKTAGATCKLRMIDFAHVRSHRDRTATSSSPLAAANPNPQRLPQAQAQPQPKPKSKPKPMLHPGDPSHRQGRLARRRAAR